MMRRGNSHRMCPLPLPPPLVQPAPTWTAEANSSLVSSPPLSPPTVHSPHMTRGIKLELRQILPLPCSEPSHGACLTQRRRRLCSGPEGPAHSGPTSPPDLAPLLPPSYPPLRSQWPPRFSSVSFLPQGLCTGSSLCLEDSSPRYLHGPPPPSSLYSNIAFTGHRSGPY